MKYLTVVVILCVTTTLAVPRGGLATQSNRVQITSARKGNIYGMFHANTIDITNCPYILSNAVSFPTLFSGSLFYVQNSNLIHFYRYEVSVYSKSYDAIIGSGTILNHYWVLLTAYEVKGLEAEDLTVRAGSNFSYTDGQEYDVSKLLKHGYFNSQFWYDIALLKTVTQIVYSESVKQINLSFYWPDANSTAVMSGYGENEEGDNILQSSTVTFLNASVCENYLFGYTKDLICASSSTAVQSAFDDFGNPLVQNNVLVGIYLGTPVVEGPEFFLNIVYWKNWIIKKIKTNNL